MVISKLRPVSPRESLLIFTACAIPIHVWAILNLLQEIPAWLMRLNLWDFLAVVAYTQSFALFETLLLSAVLLLGLFLLPVAIIAKHRVSLATGLIFVHAIWAIVVHFRYEAIRDMGLFQLIPWLLLYLISLLLVFIAVVRVEKLQRIIRSTLERLEVLSYAYLFLDLICVVIVFARNL